MLHDLQDLQALGSLTKIWLHFSDTWDKIYSKVTTNKRGLKAYKAKDKKGNLVINK